MLCCLNFLAHAIDSHPYTLSACHSFSRIWSCFSFLSRAISKPLCFNQSPGNCPQFMEAQDRLRALLANPALLRKAGCRKAPVSMGLVDTCLYILLCKVLSTLLRKGILPAGTCSYSNLVTPLSSAQSPELAVRKDTHQVY